MTLKVMFGAVSAFMIAAPALAEMNETEKRLLALLEQKQSFKNRLQPGREIQELNFLGSTEAGPIDIQASADQLQTRPIALKTAVATNCGFEGISTSTGSLSRAYTQTQTWEITRGSMVGVSFSSEINIPFVGGVETEVSGTLSVDNKRGGSASEVTTITAAYASPVSPRTEFDVQLQMVEQILDGTPFSVDIAYRGNVQVSYKPKVGWQRFRGALPEGHVIAGTERWVSDPNKFRDLVVCKRGPHAGKIVAGACHYGFGGEERTNRVFDVFVAKGADVSWKNRAEFEKIYDERAVSEGRADKAVYSGQENRTDRYAGQLLVCRAKHKGNMHPGKIVKNDCNFGYDGKEERSSDYEVLWIEPSDKADFDGMVLQDHLSDAERSFEVEGIFKDVRSSKTSVVYGVERPVDPSRCGGSEPVQSAQKSVLDVQIEKGPVTTRFGDVLVSAQFDQGVLDPVAPEPQMGDALLENATTLVTFSSARAGTAIVTLNAPLLRNTAPDLIGPEVMAVQQALQASGATLAIDGIFGAETEAAVRSFQRSARLRVDGIVGRETLSALGLWRSF